IGPAAPSPLLALDREAELLLERPADRAAHRVRLPARSLHHLGDAGPLLALQEIEQQRQLGTRTERGGGCCALCSLGCGRVFRHALLAVMSARSLRTPWSGRGGRRFSLLACVRAH